MGSSICEFIIRWEVGNRVDELLEDIKKYFTIIEIFRLKGSLLKI